MHRLKQKNNPAKPKKRTARAIVVISMALGAVAGFEGLRTRAYIDPVGVPTVCYGHTENVKLTDEYTKGECDKLLRGELYEYYGYVEKCINYPLEPHQAAAFTSATYNVGARIVCNSTLQKKANHGDIEGACNELPRWVYAKGKRLRGLVKRRESERNMCLHGEWL